MAVGKLSVTLEGYGAFMVGLGRLLNETSFMFIKMVMIYNKGFDKAVLDLLTKNHNPRTNYSPL